MIIPNPPLRPAPQTQPKVGDAVRQRQYTHLAAGRLEDVIVTSCHPHPPDVNRTGRRLTRKITPFLYRLNTWGPDSAARGGSMDCMLSASFSTAHARIYCHSLTPAERRSLDPHSAVHFHSHSRAITRGSPKGKKLPLLALLPHLTYILMSSQLLPVRTRIVAHCSSTASCGRASPPPTPRGAGIWSIVRAGALSCEPAAA